MVIIKDNVKLFPETIFTHVLPLFGNTLTVIKMSSQRTRHVGSVHEQNNKITAHFAHNFCHLWPQMGMTSNGYHGYVHANEFHL